MGLLRGVARTAVVAGTASAVSGRVQRRQQGRWAEQDAHQAQEAAGYGPPAPAAPPQYAAPPAPAAPQPAVQGGSDMDATIAQLRELAALHEQGVLTDAELAAQKARVLGS
jgi:hypothetical protein